VRLMTEEDREPRSAGGLPTAGQCASGIAVEWRPRSLPTTPGDLRPPRRCRKIRTHRCEDPQSHQRTRFPTGAFIAIGAARSEAYRTGRGSFRRARALGRLEADGEVIRSSSLVAPELEHLGRERLGSGLRCSIRGPRPARTTRFFSGIGGRRWPRRCLRRNCARSVLH